MIRITEYERWMLVIILREFVHSNKDTRTKMAQVTFTIPEMIALPELLRKMEVKQVVKRSLREK